MAERLYGAIEAGGTKFVLGVGSEAGSIATRTVPTSDPDSTLAEVEAFFAEQPRIDALGIASFGPLQLDRAVPGYGRIMSTTKPGWSGFDMVSRLASALSVPVGIDTDVNAAAVAEALAAGIGDLAYVTVGTGIGVGVVTNDGAVHGLSHPEGGHMYPRRHPAHAEFAGVCPFHHDCLEGLASGPAILGAWGGTLSQLPPGHVAFEVEAEYLAQLCASLFMLLAPKRIVLGGGVMQHLELFAPIRAKTLTLLNGYLSQVTEATIDGLIVPPVSSEPPGLVGAYLLAASASASAA
ncbi:ROK family protein [soil metagenome]